VTFVFYSRNKLTPRRGMTAGLGSGVFGCWTFESG